MTPKIELRNVTKQFGDKLILNNLNLTIEAGESVAIIGPSGSGKSTLLRLIMGLHFPDSGDVLIDGRSILNLEPKQMQDIRLKMGMLFQSGALFDSLTVAENVGFPLYENLNYENQKIDRVVKEKLDWVEMSGFESRMPDELSGGQRKRIGLARAIVQEPEIVLYDEPTTGLDPILSTNIEDLIRKLSDQASVTSVVVTHQISTILRTADKIYMLSDKKLLPPETPATIYQSEMVEYNRFIRGGL